MIGIHDRPGSFSDRWIEYCEQHGVPYKRVNCRATNIIAQLDGADGLLWNWSHASSEDQLVARQIITAVERMGILAFPNAITSEHYDDKIAQKYLLEAVKAPLIPAYVFVEKEAALAWAEKATFPKVFKLRCGAGASNVSLIKSRSEAIRLCHQMFGRGRSAVSGTYFSDTRRKVRTTRDWRHFLEKLKRLPQSLRKIRRAKRLLPKQRGYVYFQDFLPGNTFDTRVTIIGNRAFAFRRMNRPDDFRASGSGNVVYDASATDKRCIGMAFEVVRNIHSQSLALDFLYNQDGEPQIGEISYTFADYAIHNCPGYWDEAMNWREGQFWPQDAIVQDILDEIALSKKDRR